MATKADAVRKAEKVSAIVARLAEIAPHAETLIGMLDETKLDMLVLALGVGRTVLTEAEAP